MFLSVINNVLKTKTREKNERRKEEPIGKKGKLYQYSTIINVTNKVCHCKLGFFCFLSLKKFKPN